MGKGRYQKDITDGRKLADFQRSSGTVIVIKSKNISSHSPVCHIFSFFGKVFFPEQTLPRISWAIAGYTFHTDLELETLEWTFQIIVILNVFSFVFRSLASISGQLSYPAIIVVVFLLKWLIRSITNLIKIV